MQAGFEENWFAAGQSGLFLLLPYLLIGLLLALAVALLYVRHLKKHIHQLMFDVGARSRNLRNADRELKTLFDQSSIAVFLMDAQTASVLYANTTALEAFGALSAEHLSTDVLQRPDAWAPAPYSLRDFESLVGEALRAGTKSFDWQIQPARGQEIWLECSLSFLTYKSKQAMMFTGVNVTARKQTEDLEKNRQRALASMASDSPLHQTLDQIASVAESALPGARCAIMLKDSEQYRLRWAGGRSLPSAMRDAMDGVAIGYGEASPGTAVFTGTRVVTRNTKADEHWAKWYQLLDTTGVRACWSEPILGRGGETLGSFDVYHDVPWTPGDADVDLLTGPVFLASLAIERHRAQMQLEQMVVSEKAVRRISTDLLTINGDDAAEGLERTCSALGHFFRADRVFLCRVDDASQELRISHEWAGEGLPLLRPQISRPLPVIPVSLEALFKSSPSPVFDGNHPVPPMLQFLGEPLGLGSSRSLVLTGIYQGERLIGLLGLVKTSTMRAWTTEQLENVKLMASLMGNVLTREKLLSSLTFRAVHDQLTGLYNRHKLESFMEQEVARCERYSTTFSVIIFDLDHFKSINDRYGHNEGDSVLAGVAKIVEGDIRESEIAGRWGGEEFLILLPETGLQNASAVAERIRRHVEAYRFSIPVPVTISVGVATFQQGDKPHHILQRADGALYVAKGEGRNCVRTAA